MKYRVVQQHRSEFPDPLHIARGDELVIGERYEGPEGWYDWYFCTVSGQPGGWVPEQIIERLSVGKGLAREGYTARELDVDVGETLLGTRNLNGWIWCCRVRLHDSGWVPSSHLKMAESL